MAQKTQQPSQALLTVQKVLTKNRDFSYPISLIWVLKKYRMLDNDIERMIEERNEARKGGNFAAADDIRDHLKRLGVVLMDEKGARGNRRGAQVTRWRYWNP